MGVRIKRVSFGRGFTVLARQGIMKEGQTKNGNDINLFSLLLLFAFFYDSILKMFWTMFPWYKLTISIRNEKMLAKFL